MELKAKASTDDAIQEGDSRRPWHLPRHWICCHYGVPWRVTPVFGNGCERIQVLQSRTAFLISYPAGSSCPQPTVARRRP